MKVDRAGIERLVPHAGAMCLLDAVGDWQPDWIACTSGAPTTAHPLARDGHVPAIAAVEYAAQATAVHGALLEAGDRSRAGLLATLVDVRLGGASTLPAAPLAIRAELLSRSPTGCLYSFDVRAEDRPVASGRLMVALLAGAGA